MPGYTPLRRRNNRTSSWSSSSATTSNTAGVNTPSHTTTTTTTKTARSIDGSPAGHDMPPRAGAFASFVKSPAAFVVGCVPERGGVYVVREIDTGRVLALVDGRLTLISDAAGAGAGGGRGGWEWHYEETDAGWAGLRNAVSGTYLGHDNKGGYVARAARMRDWEAFVVRPRRQGGYSLAVKHWDRFKPMGVAAAAAADADAGSDSDKAAPRLVDAPGFEAATRWEFVEVDRTADSPPASAGKSIS
ncbi:putative actin cross-linking [Rosellinia necatrix]|uniref:Putative actin cross-linking n=1 Tax=Rosellinia necatrix TaxID=77044 RepID=A0A1W2TNF5_ROSNE|nr:putative actin cross-linking [Rosellinia necatrix]